MMYLILLLMLAVSGVYFMIRYYTLIHAVSKIRKELDMACQDLAQNQMIHLPLPNRHLAELLRSVNAALEDIQKERQHYEKREKEFQTLIENISHDLRTPLTVIIGYLRLFRKSEIFLPLDGHAGHKYYKCKDEKCPGRMEGWQSGCMCHSRKQELVELITVLEQKAEVMNHLVAQFYDYSRLNAGSYHLTLQQVDVSRALRESLMGNYQILQQKALNVDVKLPDHAVWVIGDTAALERIFLNLFQNAARYAQTQLRIAMQEHGTHISIIFQNDTCALAKEDIPYLFDRFYIQDHARSKGGTGLGLTVAKSLAEKMDGTLAAQVPESPELSKDAGVITISFELKLKAVV